MMEMKEVGRAVVTARVVERRIETGASSREAMEMVAAAMGAVEMAVATTVDATALG